jgi:serine/threonine protein kinase
MGATREDADATAPSADDDPAGALRGVRPAIDVLAMEDVRARAARALFGTAAPARVGRFEVRGAIAGGGMGMVYEAYDTKLDRRVALKLVHPRLHGTPHARERLIAEARVLARLDHPNVVPVHDFVEVDGQIVIVMELIAGQTLAAWERARVRSWREIAAVYHEAGRGLAAAHALGIVHRDFKPANVIVGDDGRVRVLDFGLARVDVELETPQPGERPCEVLGTLAFTSPEQLAGDLATAASDQFSFCVALHRALHGVAPFAGGDAITLAAAIRAGRVARGEGRRIPRWLQRVVERGLAAAPAERHASMQVLLANLDRRSHARAAPRADRRRARDRGRRCHCRPRPAHRDRRAVGMRWRRGRACHGVERAAARPRHSDAREQPRARRA